MRGKRCDLFVYGTLMTPLVMEAVTGRSFRFAPAQLTGYARYRIKRQVYPAIVASPESTVDGVLYYAIDAVSLQHLDNFESHVYQRREVTVSTADGAMTRADAYVIAAAYLHLLSGDSWDPEWFDKHHLQSYLKGIAV